MWLFFHFLITYEFVRIANNALVGFRILEKWAGLSEEITKTLSFLEAG